jgi:hypothetical protein
MKKFAPIVVLIAVFLIAMVIQMPSRFLNLLLDHYLDKKVTLDLPEGSLWHGNAHVALNNLQSHRSIDLGKIAWNVEPLQLLTGKLALNMTWNEGSPFWITIDGSRFHIEHAAFNLPGQVVQFLVPIIGAAELGGVIRIQADNFSLTQTQMLGNFEVSWDQVTSPLSPINPLGNYMLSFEGAGDQIKVNLKTQTTGPLILQGSGQGGVDQPFQFEGSANTLPDKQRQLQQLLQLIGNETNSGSGIYRIRI